MLATVGRWLARFAAAPSVVTPATAPTVRNLYESATQGRRARGWTAPTSGPNTATLGSLRTLRDRSRKAYRDDPYGGGAIDYRVEQLIGTGVNPKSLAPDEAFRVRVQTLFGRWARECDADGLLDFAGLQTLITREWQEAGEAFVRLRYRLPSDGLAVPLQLQILEPEFCPLDEERPAGPNRIRAGIELSPIGRRLAYWFHRAHPGDGETLGSAQLARIPAADVLHVYLPLRAGQLRGVPHMHRALLTLRDLDVGDDATLLRWQLGNMFMGWLKRSASGADAALDPITGKSIERDDIDAPIVSMEPGSMNELLPGEEMGFNDPPEAGQTYEAFMRQQLRRIAVATRTPYHALTGDMAQVNDRTIRVILQDFRRAMEQLQWQVLVHQLCQPIWSAWFARAVLSGALEVPPAFYADPEPWMDVEWAPDRWPSPHPVQDVQADREEIRAGLSSRMLKVKQRGYDVEEIDRQRAEDNARSRRLGLVDDADPSQTDGSGKAVAEPVPPEGT